jgi:hypothetical protein
LLNGVSRSRPVKRAAGVAGFAGFVSGSVRDGRRLAADGPAADDAAAEAFAVFGANDDDAATTAVFDAEAGALAGAGLAVAGTGLSAVDCADGVL